MEATQKNFRKRNAILSYLQHTDAHPSAETIFADLKSEIPDLSIGTVYRNLALFKDKGMIISVGTVKGVERFDGNTEPHVHHLCTGCGRVTDLPNIRVPEELNQAAAAQAHGTVSACQLSFTGTCAECATKN